MSFSSAGGRECTSSPGNFVGASVIAYMFACTDESSEHVVEGLWIRWARAQKVQTEAKFEQCGRLAQLVTNICGRGLWPILTAGHAASCRKSNIVAGDDVARFLCLQTRSSNKASRPFPEASASKVDFDLLAYALCNEGTASKT